MELCDLKCHDNDLVIRSTVTLKTDHISFGCDRDASKCLDQHNLIDLLPKATTWTKDLVYDEGGSDSVFHFDGNTGAIVPANVVSHHDFASHPFSIVTIFRHHNLLTSDKHTKEHIICSADDHSESLYIIFILFLIVVLFVSCKLRLSALTAAGTMFKLP